MVKFYIIINREVGQFQMSRKLKFKIISCSSEQQQYPVSSLMFAGSEGWQTKRFCTYPQEITLQFYGIVNIRKLQLVSDHRKISSQVDILYYVPISQQQERFYKYGYLQFSRSEGGNTKQLKTIMVDVNCLYIRFLFHKPHSSRENFFSQIGIQSLSLYGSEHNSSLLQEPSNSNEQHDDEGMANQEDQHYILQIMANLTAEKENAIKQQDFESANYYKNISSIIHNLAEELRKHRKKIEKALEAEDYDSAKQVNDQIKRIKGEISQILDNRQQEMMSPEAEMEDNQFANISKEENNGNQFMEPQPKLSPNLDNSRKSNKIVNNSNSNVRPIKTQIQQQQEYDQRVIPALRSDKLKTQIDQFGQEKAKELPAAEQVQGKYIKQATMMQDFFDEETIKKYFSQQWQHNLDSLNNILNLIKVKHKEAGLVKCLIIVEKYTLQQTNFQVSQQALSLFSQILKINANTQAITKPGQLQNDLDEIGKEVIKKLTDNNPKIKTAAEQAFAQMISSLLYGVQSCCLSLSKSKAKLSAKQLSTRLIMITKMIDQYGVASGANSAPLSSLDFAIQNINNPSQQVRKYAVALLSTAYRKDKDKTSGKISVLKQSIIQQIRGNAQNTPQKPKKK